MAKIIDLAPATKVPDSSVLVITDRQESKKITFLDFKSSLVKTASKTTAGVVKVGKGLAIDQNGVLSLNPAALVDPADLPPANTSTLGAIIVGSGLSVTGGGVLSVSAHPIVERDSIISANYTIANNKIAQSIGPITLNGSVTVEISRQSTWVIF